jgi:capsular polysaccharide biosynthesis protein
LRTKPKRKLMVLIGAFLTLMISIFWAFVAEYIDRVKNDTVNYYKTKDISDDIRKDWEGLKKLTNRFRKNN